MANFLELLKLIGPYAQAGGEVAGAVGAGRAGGRAQENLGSQAQDRTAIDRYQAEQMAKLGGANLLEQATQDRADRFLTDSQKRAQQVGLGDLLANVQDVSLGGLPSYIPHMAFSGGLRPSALGPNARAAGQNLSRQALEAQLSGADIPNLPDVSKLGTDAPELTPLQHSGKLDSILNVLGAVGLGAGTLNEINAERDKARAGQLVNKRLPTTYGGMTVPGNASAGGIPGATPPLQNKLNTVQLLELAARQQGQG